MTEPALSQRRSFLLPGIVFFVALGLLVARFARAQGAAPAVGTNNVLVVIHGTVEVASGARAAWTPGRTNQVLAPGQWVRTGERSRATLYLANGVTVQMSELSESEIPPSPGVNFKSGLFHILNRNPNKNFWLNLRGAIAAIRGTDFRVRVTDQSSEIIVLDGAVTLSNALDQIDLGPREMGMVGNNGQLQRTPVVEVVNNLIQWFLYYPGVLNVAELNLPAAERNALANSLFAYQRGDLRASDQTFPWATPPLSEDARAFRASLLLNAGQVEQARALVGAGATPAARAVQRLIAAVKFQLIEGVPPPASSSEWLAESYYQQSRGKLELALTAAREATNRAPAFGFGLARVAELEFGFGRTVAARAAVERSLEISPANAQAVALRGFLLAAQNKIPDARAEFDRALALDGALGNAWLGRGLVQFRSGHAADGLRSLHIAAALEPQRSVLRSYLSKAFAERGDMTHARRELGVARDLDVNDPTSWLYSALLNQESSRINEAVADLELSRELNDNRGLYRSRELLDQDRAVRSANLAAIYRDAGLSEVSVREASRSVASDYANFSSHLFLANSYTELTDPNLISLRYETATFSEYLLANLLAPVGASTLSRSISQQEYAKLFEQDRLGFSSSTFYSSQGNWQQEGSQFGTFGSTAYAVEGIYRSFNGQRANEDLDQTVLSAQFKQQITAADSIYFQAVYNDLESGDLRQYYNHKNSPDINRGGPSRRLQVTEEQEPNAFLGYHHEWSPGMHTLFLGARLNDTLELREPSALATTLYKNNAGDYSAFSNPPDVFDLKYRNETDAYSVELQQIWQIPNHTVIAGARYQGGETKTKVRMDYEGPRGGFGLFDPVTRQKETADLERANAYAYYNWQVFVPFLLSAGISYDHLNYPDNVSAVPVSGQETEKDRVSPKAGFVWTPFDTTSIRGAYTRSLGGLFYDQSVRLEPSQIAGFNQAFRSLFPESLVGPVPGSEFETFQAGLDHRFPTRTYVVLEAGILKSSAHRSIGVFELFESSPPPTASAAQTPQRLDYEERSLALTINQLLGDRWSLGTRYRLAQAELESRLTGVPDNLLPDTDQRSVLQQLNLFTIYNHASGFFSKLEALWWAQSNHDDDASLSGEDLWQFNVFAGYRFPRRRAELTVGLLNIADQDYRLNPLNLYAELPRERTLTVNFKFNF